MCIRTLTAAAVLCSLAMSAAAQSPSADERAIRELIARYDTGDRVSHADDIVFWTGDFKRPTIGSQRGEPIPAEARPSSARPADSLSERVPGSRRRITTPVRIDIAKSGDLAYEFSHSELTFDLKNGQRETAIPASVLRVWKKEAGQWKIAAMFARPHYQEAPRPATK
jgi:hypothetical protein